MSKLLFKNKIGKIYDDTIEIKSKSLKADYVEAFNLKLEVMSHFNVLSYLIGALFILAYFLIDFNFDFMLLFTGFLFIVIGLFLKIMRICVDIIVKNHNDFHRLYIGKTLNQELREYFKELKEHHKKIRTFFNF